MDTPVWIDDALVAADEATVRFDDHGLVVGDGVFETIRTERGSPFAVGRHLARLRRSAAGLGIAVDRDDDELRHAIAETLRAAAMPEARIRVTMTGGPSPSLGSRRDRRASTLVVALAPLTPPDASAAVVVVPWRRNEHGATTGLKTTSYAENVIALAHAHERGAGEALFANTAGELCEGTGSNVFVVIDDRLVTPPLSSGCLAGVTRSLVLESNDIVERAVPMHEVERASEAFLTSTTRDVQPIRTIDARPLPAAPGPHTERVRRGFAELVAENLDP